MHRRRFVALLGGAIAPPCVAAAQQKAMPVVGFLSVFSPPTDPGEVGRGPLLQGLNQTGFVEGENMSIERRWAEGHYDRLPAMAADLVSRKVDLIVTIGGTPPALAAKNATSTIPIVFAGLGNPVGTGLVASLARPGGNITGFSNVAGATRSLSAPTATGLIPTSISCRLIVPVPATVATRRAGRSRSFLTRQAATTGSRQRLRVRQANPAPPHLALWAMANLVGDRRDLGGQCEDHVEIADRQQIGRVGWLRPGSWYWRRGCKAPWCRVWHGPEVSGSHEYRHLARGGAWRNCAAACAATRAC